MSMYSAHPQDQPIVEKLSKNEIVKRVYLDITTGLSEFNLSGKKFESILKKASKQLAKQIVKAKKKKN